MRILLTGGAGFIGSHLVDAFISQGHDVLVIDDLSAGTRQNVHSGATLLVSNICSPDSASAVRRFAPHVLCHHAAQMDVRKSVADPAFDAQVNIVGLLNILAAAHSARTLEYVLFASSGGAIYGEQAALPTPETAVLNPISPYGAAKATGEQYLALYHRLHGTPYAALRYANVYGPRQTPDGEAGVVSIFTGRLLAHRPIEIFGDGKQTRDFVFVGDIVRANLIALEKRIQGPFNVGMGLETTVGYIAAALSELCGLEPQLLYRPPRKGEQRRSAVDPSKLETATGFRPRTPLLDGLRATLEYLAAAPSTKLPA